MLTKKPRRSPPVRVYVDFNGSPALYAIRGECDMCEASRCGRTRYLGKGLFRCADCDAAADLKRYGATYSAPRGYTEAPLVTNNTSKGAPWE